MAHNWYALTRVSSGTVTVLQDDAQFPPERLLQSVWAQQRLLRGQLQSLDGETVRVLHPGFQNLEGGPDFRGAVIQFGSQPPTSGDVEVDLRPGGWHAHGHDRNPAFRNVILHVIWDGERAASASLRTLKLKGVLDAPIGELSLLSGTELGRGLADGFAGKCSVELERLGESGVEKFLCEAAAVRLEAKAAAFAARARQAGWDQSLWEGLFRGLGYKHNRWAMQWLAELLPRIRSQPSVAPGTDVLGLQSRLLGVSGLLPTDLPTIARTARRGKSPGATASDTTGQLAAGAGGHNLSASSEREYVRRVWDVWWREREIFGDCLLPASLWRMHGIRPANHPQRRVALGAHWVISNNLPSRLRDWCTQDIPEAALCASLANVLDAGVDDFWCWHWSLHSVRLPRPQRLLGLARVSDLGVNVVLPWLYARSCQDRAENKMRQGVIDRYFAWRASEDNAVLRLARQRLLRVNSSAGRGLKLSFKRAALQQGLLQVVRDFCECSNAVCDGCRLPESLRGDSSRTWAGSSIE